MQYILTEGEYNALLSKKKKAIDADKKELQDFCTKVANEMPAERPYAPDNKEPWGCILTNKHDWYCDRCPAKQFCPYPHKEFSK